METATELSRYLEEVTGEPACVSKLRASALRRVPLFLRSSFELLEGTLLGHRFALAVQKDGSELLTPLALARQLDALKEALGRPVVLVLQTVPTSVRNRLLQKRVPFIVPGRQMFLPFLALMLVERATAQAVPPRQTLTPPAQLVLLAHLQGCPVGGRPLGEVAATLGYSAMTLSKVAKDLEALGLATIGRQGKTKALEFSGAPRELWDRALLHLTSPVEAHLWARFERSKKAKRIAAGLTGLGLHTSIADDPIPTIALWRNTVRAGLTAGDLRQCAIPDDAEARVEVWSYDPSILASGHCADPLSLYLSLRGSPDERIQKALVELMEEVKW